MSGLNEKPGEAMAADVAKATASQTSFAGRIRNYFLTPVWSLLAKRFDPDPGRDNVAPHSREMPQLGGARSIPPSDFVTLIQTRFLRPLSNIRRPSDVNGVYGAAGAGVAVGPGAGGIVLTNQNGAALTLAGRQAGLIVAADLNGLVISLR
jgi:hypothetical protein